MNKRHRGMLYGMVLGDGNLYLHSPKNCVLTIGHGPKQKEYLEFKANLLHSILGGKAPYVGMYRHFNNTTNKTYENWQLKKSYKYFRQMHRVLYASGRKRYTRKALDYLTDYGLALWYCDDGNGSLCRNKNKTVSGCMTRISTYCTLEEAEVIRDWFRDRYDITVKFDTDKRNNLVSIRMNTKESKKFVSIIAPYVPVCMKYKIAHVDMYVPRVQNVRNTDDDIV